MKVLIYNKRHFAKYIPLTPGRHQHDYDVARGLMPKNIYAKLLKLATQKTKQVGYTNILYNLPVGVDVSSARKAGCFIVEMSKEEYEKVKDAIN